ncbi:Por secretion system C-terminal sorting domain-containing protein [Nonlabens sp. Hel1_33_55]|uniref:family 16 glycosylhydrolase n=1 Tax=Nonlabens sp. Hel1_33_55 TaxID=1336802 RepID=UPI000875B706|nr:family 16 glycosylhydrolase [Nonlabens sp. Hel1_33_55]SCY38913.1 Por secretion system C-terminal sorting domain-containing protein [Nonlabens sp. Hel1_33_55]
MFKTTFCFLILISSFLHGQQMPVDFSETSEIFTGFSGSTFSKTSNPENSSDAVGQFLNDGRVDFQGFFLDLNRNIDLSFQQTIQLEMYASDDNAHTVLLKLENGSEDNVEVQAQLPANSGDNWRTLMFDFSNARFSDGGATTNATGSYSRLTIFIDGGQLVPGTYLIDDIDDGSTEEDPEALDVIYDNLVWSDEFDSPNGAKQVINAANWFHQTQIPAGGNWFNGEVQHYTNRIDNSFVEDGFLNIVAIRENYRDQGVTKDFTSARLNSKFAFTYGRVDVLAKLPFGEGTFPAIWTLGKNINEDGGFWDEEFGTVNWPRPGEIDIMEHGLGATNQVGSALHTPCEGCFGNTRNNKSIFISNVAEDFHLYSMNWSPDQITFLIDNEPFYTYNPEVKDAETWPFDKDQYMLLNVAMGGISGSVEPGFTQSPMVIDYVRVYQKSTASIGDEELDKVRLFPNPASDLVSIQSVNPIDTIEIYSMLGSQIQASLTSNNSFSVSGLSSGIYLVKMVSGASVSTKRLIVK